MDKMPNGVRCLQ